MIRATGVFATEQERAELLRRKFQAAETPVIKVHGRWLADDAHEAFMAAIDALAVTHGLPEPKPYGDDVNHYGMSNDGQFMIWEPDDADEIPPAEKVGSRIAMR
jgi:hypothetical protein